MPDKAVFWAANGAEYSLAEVDRPRPARSPAVRMVGRAVGHSLVAKEARRVVERSRAIDRLRSENASGEKKPVVPQVEVWLAAVHWKEPAFWAVEVEE